MNRAKNNKGFSLGWGIYQNPTNNKMWTGKQGEEKMPGTGEQNSSRKKGKGEGSPGS